MRDDLGWSYTRAGGTNTANAIGYIAGAAGGAWLAKRLGNRRAFIATLALSAAALTATAATSDYAVLLALRATGGVASAVAFVVGSSLAARLRPGVLPVYFAGVGIGIVLSGIVVPSALAGEAIGSWRLGWLLLGIASLLALTPAWLAARAVPETGERPVATLSVADVRRLGPTLAGWAWSCSGRSRSCSLQAGGRARLRRDLRLGVHGRPGGGDRDLAARPPARSLDRRDRRDDDRVRARAGGRADPVGPALRRLRRPAGRPVGVADPAGRRRVSLLQVHHPHHGVATRA